MHCYTHALNLAVQDVTKECYIIREALDISNKVIKTVKRSPKREEELEQKQVADPTIQGLCKYYFCLLCIGIGMPAPAPKL